MHGANLSSNAWIFTDSVIFTSVSCDSRTYSTIRIRLDNMRLMKHRSLMLSNRSRRPSPFRVMDRFLCCMVHWQTTNRAVHSILCVGSATVLSPNSAFGIPWASTLQSDLILPVVSESQTECYLVIRRDGLHSTFRLYAVHLQSVGSVSFFAESYPQSIGFGSVYLPILRLGGATVRNASPTIFFD